MTRTWWLEWFSWLWCKRCRASMGLGCRRHRW